MKYDYKKGDRIQMIKSDEYYDITVNPGDLGVCADDYDKSWAIAVFMDKAPGERILVYTNNIKKVEEKNMNREIKVGDRVRRKLDEASFGNCRPGDTGTVTRVRSNGVEFNVQLDHGKGDPGINYAIEKFELLEESPVKTKLETLVEQANAGIAALVKLRDLDGYEAHSTNARVRIPPQHNSPIGVLDRITFGWLDGQFKYRIKVKPKFEPYTIKGPRWEVNADSHIVSIGCQTFATKCLVQCLNDLINNGAHANSVGPGQQLFASKNGITLNSNKNQTLTWTQAEELLSKLKEIV